MAAFISISCWVLTTALVYAAPISKGDRGRGRDSHRRRWWRVFTAGFKGAQIDEAVPSRQKQGHIRRVVRPVGLHQRVDPAEELVVEVGVEVEQLGVPGRPCGQGTDSRSSPGSGSCRTRLPTVRWEQRRQAPGPCPGRPDTIRWEASLPQAGRGQELVLDRLAMRVYWAKPPTLSKPSRSPPNSWPRVAASRLSSRAAVAAVDVEVDVAALVDANGGSRSVNATLMAGP